MTPMTAPRVKLDIDATREKLAALGLGHAVDALQGLLTDAVRAEMPAHVFLDRLLGAERSGREERRITTMLKTSKLPTGQTLENFDFAFQPAIERSRVETLATGAWIRNAEVVLLQGPPGVGKSHILVGLGVRAIQLGFSVQYFRFDELLTALKADAHVPPARLKSRKYMSSALLLVDEMGYDPMSREEASLFFRLVSYRYGRGAMIITTNKSIRDWTELLAGDEVLATAILDRLLHRSHVLNIKGRSYRLRDLEAACGPERPVALARELTKLHEEIRRGTIGSVRAELGDDEPRGECVLVLGGAPVDDTPAGDEEVDAALTVELAAGASTRDAADAVSARLRVARRDAYARAVTLKGR